MKHALIAIGVLSLSILARADNTEYQPQTQPIRYRYEVPFAIRLATQKTGPTRFFGLFARDSRNFAVHLYDQSAVEAKSRDSRVDVWQKNGRNWRKIQSLPFTRRIADKDDKLLIQAQSLWLDPARRELPMIHLRMGEKTEIPEIGIRTDIYDIVQIGAGADNLIALQGNVPYSDATVALSQISFPDPDGNLTLLATVSDPGETSYTAYGWRGKGWQVVGQTTFDNAYETARRWNGNAFIPLADADLK